MKLKLRLWHNRDPTRFNFVCRKDIKAEESCICYITNEIIVSSDLVENCGFWVHEFTEAKIIQILVRWRKPWNKLVRFDGFKTTIIPHIISPHGMDNGRNLFPQKNKNKPEW